MNERPGIFRISSILKKEQIPFYVTRVPAGFPSPASDHREERIDLNKLLMNDPDNTFVIPVNCNSMVDACILPGSQVVADQSIKPRSGDIIAGYLFDELTIKFYKTDGQQRWLIPAAPGYKPLEIFETHEFILLGVITYILLDTKCILNPAGFDKTAPDLRGKEINLNKLLITNPKSSFVMQVTGNSMVKACLMPGCYIIVDKSIEIESGQIIVASIFDDWVVKIWKKQGHKCWLVPAANGHSPLEITAEHDLHLWGVVSKVIINARNMMFLCMPW